MFRIARRVGKLDASGAAGDLSAAALQHARCAALLANALEQDVDDATVAGLEAGRGGWTCLLGDLVVPTCAHEYTN